MINVFLIGDFDRMMRDVMLYRNVSGILSIGSINDCC